MTDLSLNAPQARPAGGDAPEPRVPLEAAPEGTGAGDPPPPSRATFDVLPLSRDLRETLAEIGYTHPTPVQIAVWEPATRGKDAVVQARTGTGKTAAFGLPIVDHIVRKSQAQVQVLALCPTRELALQVAAELERLGKRRNVKVSAIYGGAPMPRQIAELADGAQVVVGTPGRVLDHLRRGTLDARHIRMLVLDEADEMLSMGFEREVTAILESLPKDRQTLLFSATVPPDIERMARKLRAPEYVTLSGDHIGALEIEHFVFMVTSDKIGALVRVIEVENPESAVVFCNTKDETERVAGALQRQGYDADWLNGDLPQSDREKVMSATREGRLRFLVATDVAARGIDISHLTHVINHDFPQDAESYVHRTGRTGRAGRTGTALSLITPQDVGGLYLLRLTYKIRPVERQIPSEGELKTRGEADLTAMLVEAFARPDVHPDDLALARRLLTHEQCDRILAGLLRDHLGARPTAKQEAAAARRATRSVPALPNAGRRGVAAQQAKPERRDGGVASAPVVATASPAAVAHATPAAAPAAALAPTPLEGAPRTSRESAPQAERSRDEGRDRRGPRPDRPRPPHGAREPRDRDQRDPRDTREARDASPEEKPTGAAPTAPHVPVSAATGSLEGSSRNPRRHADFSTWQPPEEEGDDEPILSAGSEGQAREIDPRGRGRGRDRRPLAPPAPAPDAITMGAEPPYPAPRAIATDAARPAQADEAADTGDFAEIYVNIGRRDGARAIDFQQILTDKAGLDRAHVRRIRVRERNAFVSVKRDDLARALGALAGSSIAGKVALAEQARERSDPDTPMQDAVTLVPAPITSAIEGEVHAATRVDDDRTHPNADALRAEPAPEDDAPVTGRST